MFILYVYIFKIFGLSVTLNGSSILFINVYFPVAWKAKYEDYIMCLDILSSILESHEEDMYAHWETLMQCQVHCDLMKFVTCNMGIIYCSEIQILSMITYIHVNNGSQTCSWLDHIIISNFLSKTIVGRRTPQDLSCSDYRAITVTFNFYQLKISHNIVRQEPRTQIENFNKLWFWIWPPQEWYTCRTEM